ncbi:TPR domain-containing protein [Colletotrichum musicola]|uniref:TPR domain-containing protein n=1 Tax=Colletotrichum musicola TaxID=2175873 RepID=A0A8H6NDJ4_9PEZI|nr:TPR domain-containing protein [Colletotrichum musicola]
MPTLVLLPPSRAQGNGQSERDGNDTLGDARPESQQGLEELAQSVDDVVVATHEDDLPPPGSPPARPSDKPSDAPVPGFGGYLLPRAEHNPNHTEQWIAMALQLHKIYMSLHKAGAPTANGFLDESIKVMRKAVECRCMPEHEVNRGGYLGNLGAVLAYAWWHRRSFEALAEAIDVTRQCLELMPLSHPRRILVQHNLAEFLFDQFEWFSKKADLEESIQLSREIAAVTPSADPHRALILRNLGSRLGIRYFHYYKAEDSEEALFYLKEALEILPDGDPEQPLCRSVEDLNEAVSITKSLVGIHEDKAGVLHQLGIQLGLKYASTGDFQILNEAVEAMRGSLAHASADDQYRPQRLTHLSTQLHNRWKHQGAMGDLEESIAFTREAFQTMRHSHSNWIQVVIGLGARLMDMYRRTRSAEGLSEAICVTEEAITLTPGDDINQAALLSNLASCLGFEWKRTRDVRVLDRSIRTLREGVKRYGDYPFASAIHDNFALALIEKYNLEYSKEVLEEGIQAAREAVASTSESNLDWARRLGILGSMLYGRSQIEGSDVDLQESLRLWRSGIDHSGSPIHERVDCGRHLLSCKGLCSDADLAYYAAQTTIQLIGLSAPNALEISDKHYALSNAVGLASDAAAVALEVGKDAVCAVELLESGRNLLAGSLRGIRTDLSSLQQLHPDLAGSFVSLRDQLDQPVSHLGSGAGDPSGAGSAQVDRRRLADEEMGALLEEIRARPGFERFLLSSTENEMRGAAVDGSVVVVNVSWLRCDALIVQKKGFRSLRLPKLSLKDIRERARNVQSLDVLAWLWDAIVEPILGELGFTDRPAPGEPLPRIWWVPTGPLVQFPLHAAGYHLEKGFKTTLDRVVSSYSSSIRSIIHTRRHKLRLPTSDHGGPRNAVLVAMQQTPGFNTLANAESEVHVVEAACKAMGMSCKRPDVRRRRQVAEALEECAMFHFAGHGYSSAQHPLKSSILLEDHQKEALTIESLLQTRLGNNAPFLAYLSACGTGEVRDDNSADESIHLTSAFQLAGFRHVVGTLWDVEDRTCVGMARLTYEYIQEHGWSDDSISGGLHHATRKLRDNWARLHEFGKGQSASERGLQGIEDLSLMPEVEDPGSMPRSCRQSGTGSSLRTIAPEGISGPKWVPYIHYGV